MNTDLVQSAASPSGFVLMLLRVPVGMAMGLVGVSGYALIAGGHPALKLVGQTSMRTVTDYTFGVIPMFMLMGAFVSVSGVSRELFRAANALIGRRRGGLGMPRCWPAAASRRSAAPRWPPRRPSHRGLSGDAPLRLSGRSRLA